MKAKEWRVQTTVFCTVVAETEEEARETVEHDLCGMSYGATEITGGGEVEDIALASEAGW